MQKFSERHSRRIACIFDRDTPGMLCSWGTATLARRKTLRIVLTTFYQPLNLVIDIDIASSGK
jgi:hypothetical protein